MDTLHSGPAEGNSVSRDIGTTLLLGLFLAPLLLHFVAAIAA
jgi:hypothetical protein